MKLLGLVPFAAARVENGQLVKTCPDCGLEFCERTDSLGEPTTDNYASHWKKEHGS